MYIDIVPNRRSPPAILLRESIREGGRANMRQLMKENEIKLITSAIVTHRSDQTQLTEWLLEQRLAPVEHPYSRFPTSRGTIGYLWPIDDGHRERADSAFQHFSAADMEWKRLSKFWERHVSA